jgi:hypothetical protein
MRAYPQNGTAAHRRPVNPALPPFVGRCAPDPAPFTTPSLSTTIEQWHCNRDPRPKPESEHPACGCPSRAAGLRDRFIVKREVSRKIAIIPTLSRLVTRFVISFIVSSRCGRGHRAHDRLLSAAPSERESKVMLVRRYLFERERVHAVAQPAGRRPIGKDMAEMGVAHIAGRFNPRHIVAAIHPIGNHIGLHGLGE